MIRLEGGPADGQLARPDQLRVDRIIVMVQAPPDTMPLNELSPVKLDPPSYAIYRLSGNVAKFERLQENTR